MTAALALAAAYLIGALPIGFLIARAFGLGDIRRHGSGNIGATNVLRTLGKGPAVLTLVGDIVKGWLAVWAATAISGHGHVTATAAVLAVVGNCWSVFLGFRGGKGVATGLGAMLRLVPWATLPAAAVWLAVAGTFRYASLASLTAAVCIPLGVLAYAVAGRAFGYGWPEVAATAMIAAIVVLRHHENIARLRSGTETRIGQRSATA
ncbi:MAG: glycerol-3-phosphate 1-O-acyltransferase PlsY [Candidatus Rokubacteria bacterium]|nr:glycerol-3-phosphate 1-O-acyltransferase PlsY [Candidatus Rokubacteria bacterium]